VGEARGTYAGEPLVAHFAGVPPFGALASQPWLVEIAVQHGPTQASLKGTLPSPSSLHGAALDVAIAGPDMARLRALTGVPFPVTPPYELRGKLDSSGETYRVTGAKGRLGRSELDGTMTVTLRTGQRPEMTAEVLSSATAQPTLLRAMH
jgi:AsmA family protein